MRARASETPNAIRAATKPVDLATHLYLAIICVLIVAFALEAAWPNLLLAVASSAVLLGIQLAWRHRSDYSGAVARLVYFVGFIPVFYLQLKTLIPAIHPQPLDAVLRDIDRAIFGTDPTIALQAIVHPLATEILQIAYMTYYIFPLILPVLLLRKGRVRETEKFTFALLLCYFITYVGYIAVPANGPVATIQHDFELQGLLVGGALHEMILSVDAHRFDCFPSGHTAVAVLVAAYAWRFRLRPAAALLTVMASLIVVATVYMRYHYVIDLPPGVLVAAGCYGIGEWYYGEGDSVRPASSPS